MILQCPFTSGLLGPFVWVFMAIGGLVYVVLSLLIAKYMHKDAIKRGIRNSEFWLIIGLLLNLFGLLLYCLVRNNYNLSVEQKRE
jgi:Trk-type K+ transport system membrane component